jgi:hypothetical protein
MKVCRIPIAVEHLPGKLKKDAALVNTERQQTSRRLLVNAEQTPGIL